MIFNSAKRPSMQLMFSNDIVEVWKDELNDHFALYAVRGFKSGDTICEVEASAVLHTPSYLTIQKDEDEHICLQPQFLQYTNHSCLPNIFFDINKSKVICIQAVKPGDELTYFYPSTEWDMAEPFHCHCGNANCLKEIRGAAYLSDEVLSKYRLSDFIQRQIRKRS